MKRVLQRFNSDCGVAATAILAGVSYKKARNAIWPIFEVVDLPKKCWGTSTKEIVHALNRLGIKTKSKKIIPTKYFNVDKIKNLEYNALLAVNRSQVGLKKKDWDWHWVVWDAKKKCVLDPSPSIKLNAKKLNYYNVNGYVEILS